MKSCRNLFIILILLFFANIEISFAQLNNPENWKLFQSPEAVNTIFEDGNKLWIGTKHGLVVLDKETMAQAYYTATNSDLPAEDVMAIEKIGDTHFIGTYDLMLLQINDNTWTSTPIPSEEELDFTEMPLLYCMQADKAGNLWIGTSYGVVKYDGQSFEIFNHNTVAGIDDTFGPVWNIKMSDDGKLYFSSFEIFEYDGANFKNLSDGNFDLFAYSTPFMEYTDGQLWFSSFGSIIARYDEENWHFVDADAITSDILTDMAIDKNGQAYFNYQYAGAFTIENNTMVASDILQGEDTFLDQIFFDSDNNLWATSKANILVKKDNETSKMRLGNTPLINNEINFITEDNNGTIYLLNDNHIMTYNEVNEWQTLDIPEDLETGFIYQFSFDSQNELWAATVKGLLHYDGINWELLNTENTPEIPFTSCSSLRIDHYDRKWLSLPNQILAFYDGHNWETIHSFVNAGQNSAYGLRTELDAENNLWVTNPNGDLFRLTPDGALTPINTSEIYSSENGLISTLYFDKNNRLWVITNYQNAYRVFKYENNEWIEFDDEADNYYTGSIGEREDGIYFSTTAGILHLNNEGEVAYINTENSLLKGTDNYIPQFLIDSRGDMWIHNYRFGLNVYNPDGFIISAINDINEVGDPGCQTYPNPSNGLLKIYLTPTPALKEKEIPVQLINSLGQTLKTFQLTIEQGKTEMTFDLNLSSLNKGIYWIKVGQLPAKAIMIE